MKAPKATDGQDNFKPKEYCVRYLVSNHTSELK